MSALDEASAHESLVRLGRSLCGADRQIVKWRTRHDLNVRPLPSEGNALSS